MAKFCPSCRYHEMDDNALFCNKCGYPFPPQPSGHPAAQAGTARAPVHVPDDNPRRVPSPARKFRRRKSGGGFFSFGTLITENHLKLIYILGAAIIVLAAVLGITGGFAVKGEIPSNASFTNTTAAVQHPGSSPLFWIGFLVAGSVLWRMFCELFAMRSREPGQVTSYEEPGGYDDPLAGGGGGSEDQMVECPKCHKIVPVEDLRECEHCGIQGCSNCIRRMGLVKKTMTCRECYEGE